MNIAGFDLPPVTEGDKLTRILAGALPELPSRDRIMTSDPDSTLYWDATHFGLERVTIFQDASREEQQAIAQVASQGLLTEAYFVEKAGMGYMSKMALLAESLEERMLYALFAADETTHLAQIRSFLPEEPVGTQDPFLRFLGDVVTTDDKAVLLFMIQVVLEGWGISHYHSLAKGCRSPQLSQLFEQFLQAEARHHGTGVTLFNQQPLSTQSRGVLTEALTLFLRMVQVGPQRVLSAIAQVKGDLSRSQQIQILQELETETQSGTRLNYLRSLMQKTKAQNIIQELEERGSFQAFSAERCV